MYTELAFLALAALLYSAIAGRIDKSWVSGPIVFLALGVLVGQYGLKLLVFSPSGEEIKTLAELTLAFVLFNDAASTDLKAVRSARKAPLRMLLIGLPLTIGIGYLLASWCFPSVPALELALLAIILAPTDAALGKAVVSNESVHPSIRSTLNVESGLNDGLCVPALMVCLAFAAGDVEITAPMLIVEHLAADVGIGAAVGIGLVYVASKMLRYAHVKMWLAHSWMPVPVMALALGTFALAQAIGGSGFIAAFVGGLFMNRIAQKEVKVTLLVASEGVGEVMAMVTWVVFGAGIVPVALMALFAGEWFFVPAIVFSLLALTVMRMVPVIASISGIGMSFKSKVFVSWFGPRGLASIVFVVIALQEELVYKDLIAIVAVTTITLSVLAHGTTANWLAKKWGPQISVPPVV